MRLEIIAETEQITLSHDGPTKSQMSGLIYTRKAAHAMLDTALDSLGMEDERDGRNESSRH